MPYERMAMTTCKIHQGDNLMPHCPVCLLNERDVARYHLRNIIEEFNKAGIEIVGDLPEDLHRAIAEATEWLEGRETLTNIAKS